MCIENFGNWEDSLTRLLYFSSHSEKKAFNLHLNYSAD